MAKATSKKHKEWMIRVKQTLYTTVFVKAATPEDAENSANAGIWDDETFDELVDWEVAGNPVENV